MARVRFENGYVINFEGTPTQADIEEVATRFGIASSAPSTSSSPGVPQTQSSRDGKRPFDKIRKKAQQFGEAAGRVGSAAGNALFGAAAKVIGAPILSGVGSALELAGNEQGRRIREEAEKTVFGAERNPTAGQVAQDAAFAALELYPGGGFVSRAIKSLPGAAKIARSPSVLKVVPARLREGAIKSYAQALGPTKEEFKHMTRQVVPELLERGVKGTREKILAVAERGAEEAGKRIDEFFMKLPEGTKLKVKPILDALESSKKQFVVEGTNVVADPHAIKQIDDLKQVIAELGDAASPESLRSLRQIWDKAVAQAKGFVGKTLKEGTAIEVKREATNAIRRELAKEFPDLARINAEYAFWSRVRDILEETAKRTLPQSGGLGRLITTTGGAVAGFASGDDFESRIGKAIGYGVAGKYLIKFFQSPAWRTFNAVQKNKLAELLARGDPKKISMFIGKAWAGLKNLSEE